MYLIGRGHSGEINRVMIASDGKHLVSVSADGAIIRWKMPPIADIDIVDQQMKNVVVGDVDSAENCEEESSQNDGDDDDKEDVNKDENAEEGAQEEEKFEGGGEEKEQKEQEVKEEEQIKKSTPTTGACESE